MRNLPPTFEPGSLFEPHHKLWNVTYFLVSHVDSQLTSSDRVGYNALGGGHDLTSLLMDLGKYDRGTIVSYWPDRLLMHKFDGSQMPPELHLEFGLHEENSLVKPSIRCLSVEKKAEILLKAYEAESINSNRKPYFCCNICLSVFPRLFTASDFFFSDRLSLSPLALLTVIPYSTSPKIQNSATEAPILVSLCRNLSIDI
jgi:hypothetical protein